MDANSQAQVGSSDFRLVPAVTGAKVTGLRESLQQETERDVLWYRDNFLGKRTVFFCHQQMINAQLESKIRSWCIAHKNLLAIDSPRGPISVSLVKDGVSYKGMVRTGSGNEKFTVEASEVPISWWRTLFDMGPTVENILSTMSYTIPYDSLESVKHIDLPTDLLATEERQIIRSYKLGVLYAGPGQTTEIQALSNLHGE